MSSLGCNAELLAATLLRLCLGGGKLGWGEVNERCSETEK